MAPSVSIGASKVSDYRGGQQPPAFVTTNARAAKDKIPEVTTVGDNNMAPRQIQTTPQNNQKSRPVTVAGSSAGNGLRGPHFINKDPLRSLESNKATTMTPSQQTVSSNLPPKTADNSSMKLRKDRRRSTAAEAAGLLIGEQGLRRAPTSSTVPTLPPLLADATSSSGSRQSDRREAKVGDGGSSLKPTVRRRLSLVSASDSNLPSRKLAAGHGTWWAAANISQVITTRQFKLQRA